jgi:hypothetical protein
MPGQTLPTPVIMLLVAFFVIFFVGVVVSLQR